MKYEPIQSKEINGYYYAWSWSDFFGCISAKIAIKDNPAKANSEAIDTCFNKIRILGATLPLIKA